MRYTQKSIRNFSYCLTFLIAIIIFTLVVKIYFKPFFIIVFFILACRPIYNLLLINKIFNNKIDALLSLILINLSIFSLIFFIGNFLFTKINIFITYGLPSFQLMLNKISVNTGISLENINSKLGLYYSDILNSGFLTKGAVNTTEGLFTYFIGNITAYFILSDSEFFSELIVKILPPNLLHILKRSTGTIKNIIKIELLLVSATTLVTVLGFYILNVENSLLLGLICGLLDILPYIGTAIIFIPLILYKIITKQYIISIGIILLYTLLIISRQLLEAKFMSNKLQLHPLAIILSSYIGIKIFGIIGLFIGPIYIITVREFLNSE